PLVRGGAAVSGVLIRRHGEIGERAFREIGVDGIGGTRIRSALECGVTTVVSRATKIPCRRQIAITAVRVRNVAARISVKRCPGESRVPVQNPANLPTAENL